MNTENTLIQMRKGILEFCILSIIDQKEVYASEIIAKLKEAKLLVVEGTIYPLLTRLKNNQMLSYEWQESESGPPRKYYKLTAQGKELLKQQSITWDELVMAVEMTTKHTKR
ncbi:MAG: PadR family transcriptional regulator PadR [Sphingobacteriales bacterium]|jgi:PadR family transcriptional regulator PadR